MNVTRACHMLPRLSLLSSAAAVLHETNPCVDIKVHDDGGSASSAAAFFVAANGESFKGLVKDKREDCFRRLGGSAGIAAALESGAERGIRGDGGDVARRRDAFGGNTYPKRKPKSFWSHVSDALSDIFLIGLLVGAVLFLGFGIRRYGLKDGWYDGVSILLAVCIVVAVSAFTNHSQAKRFGKLATESENFAVTVVRAAKRQEVSLFDIVVGDVAQLKIGDTVPADGVFLEGHALQVDESSMTGETHPVEVDKEKSPFLASGVKVVDGYGRMLVTAVGKDTAWGEMMATITKENTDPTPLEERLDGLTLSIGKTFGMYCLLVGVFKHAVNISVVTIPGSLPLAVILMRVLTVNRMMKENVLVRRLSACETMGSVTAICTDMIGTLTLNQMKVAEFWVGNDRPAAATAVAGAVVSLLCQGVGLNTTGSVYKPDNVSPPEITGSSTEKALLSWGVANLGMDADALKRSCKVLHVEAFNSDKKRSGVLIRDGATGVVIAHWKGAAEMVLARCSMYVDTAGAPRLLGVEQRRNLEKVINDMALASLRCIAFAYKQVDGEHTKIDDEGLTLLAVVGLKDPCRPKVKSAITACTNAGIAVKMVTGDNVLTARAIARECSIISDNDPRGIVLEGREFRAMSPVRQLEVVDDIRVMARSLHMDKLLLVQRLKQKGHVVAVTGDGTNDAPALKEADVGLSMGIQGTEVAKESSDIVILNDSFGTVVMATRWGRCVFNNIQKFIQFQLTVIVSALVINFLSVVTTGNMPLTTAQLLWVHLITNTIGALALATETSTKGLMERPPIGRTAPLVSNAMLRNIAGQAAFQVVVLLALQFRGRDVFGTGEKTNETMIFNAFVLCQVFNQFNAREIEKRNVFAGVLRNWMFLAIIVVTLILQVVMIEVRGRFAGTERLGWAQWMTCVAIAVLSWPIGLAVKFIHVPQEIV